MEYLYYTIIPDATGERVLLLPEDGGWTLPHFARAERHFWQEVDHINRAVQDLLNVTVTTLRCLHVEYESAVERVVAVYALESHTPAWTPPEGARWVARGELGGVRLAVPEHGGLLRGWFAWLDAAGRSPLRVPWYKRGWFERAAAWLHRQLGRSGLAATGPIEQLRSWQRSTVLRVPTTGGRFYFKAVPTMFARELSLTQALARQYPASFPEVLAVDLAERWLLMPESGGETLDRVADVRLWEAALRSYAEIQVALARSPQRLLALGCPDRRLGTLAGQVGALLADTEAMLPERPGGLSHAQIAALREYGGQLEAMCRRLQAYGIPASLEHGDFWAGQVVANGDEFVFIDWSDSSLAHPFFSLLFFSTTLELEQFLPDVPDARLRLRDAYLEPWSAHAPRHQLLQAFELSQRLAPLHHALIYHQLILPNMEIRWEMETMVPFFLKMLLPPESGLGA